jgi:CheY-like chemotaxis protein
LRFRAPASGSRKELAVVNRRIQILLVEDNENDAVLFKRAVRRINPDAVVSHVLNATAASVFLKQDGVYPDTPRPDIVVCDSIFNSESGLDLVRWARKHPRFRKLPFVILSGTINPEVHSRLAKLDASAFFQKPADTASFRETVRQILQHVPPAEE